MSTNGEAELPSLLDLLLSTTESSLDSAQAQSYVKRLASLGLDDLKHEPAIITNERATVESELVNLCYREYPTFTSVHRCSSAVGSAFDDFDTSLGDLIKSIPALEEECRQFSQHNASIQASRRKAVLLQDHEDKLLNMLEVPQLMETCVRNGHYQEALDLAAHVSSIHERMGIAIVSDIAHEVDNVLQLMTAQLLGVLREPVKLPALLKAVNYLRRLQSLGDEDIALVFLSSRLHNYRARLVDIENHRAEPVRYLRKYIDLFREHVFDIISQYTTIFAGDIGTLPTFACLCVEDLVDLVGRYIPRIASDPASISSIMVQLGYCSLSFSRVGLDFSALLAEPFTSSIFSSFEQAVATAADVMIDVLSTPGASPSTLLISTNHLAQVLADPNSPPPFFDGTDPHTPPAQLAQYPPLAQCLNSHLASLNALRLLAPFQLAPALSRAQCNSLQQVSNAILSFVEEAVTDDTAPPLARAQSGSRHSRTGSTPRAQLIRRNTETQLSSETLLARRRETKRVCVAFADAWLHTIRFLRDGLAQVLEQASLGQDSELQACTQRVERWIKDNGEVEDVHKEVSSMGNVDEESEVKSPHVSTAEVMSRSPTLPASPASPVSPTPQRRLVVTGNMSPPRLPMASLPSSTKMSVRTSTAPAAATALEIAGSDEKDVAAGQPADPEPTDPTTEPNGITDAISTKHLPVSGTESASSRPSEGKGTDSISAPAGSLRNATGTGAGGQEAVDEVVIAGTEASDAIISDDRDAPAENTEATSLGPATIPTHTEKEVNSQAEVPESPPRRPSSEQDQQSASLAEPTTDVKDASSKAALTVQPDEIASQVEDPIPAQAEDPVAEPEPKAAPSVSAPQVEDPNVVADPESKAVPAVLAPPIENDIQTGNTVAELDSKPVPAVLASRVEDHIPFENDIVEPESEPVPAVLTPRVEDIGKMKDTVAAPGSTAVPSVEDHGSGPTADEEVDDGTKTPGSVGTIVEETSTAADAAPKTSTSSKKKKKKKGKK